MANFSINVTDPDGNVTPFFVTDVNSREEAREKLSTEFVDREGGNRAVVARRADLKAQGVDLDTKQTAEAGGGLNRFAIGAGRTLTELGKGGAQLVHQARDNQAGADAIAAGDEDEARIFEEFDSQQIGLEDLGQIAPDLLAFAVPGLAAARGAKAAASSTVAIGGALGGLTLQGEGEGALARVLNAGTGAAIAAVLPAAGGIATFLKSKKGAALRGAQELLTRGRTAEIVEQMATLGTSKADQIVMRAAMDKAIRVMNGIPAAEVKLFGKESAFGMLKAATAKATKVVGGQNILNPTKFEKELLQIASSDIGRGLSKAAGTAVKDLKKMATALQGLPQNISKEAAESVALAVVTGGSTALNRAIASVTRAKSASAKKVLWDRVVSLASRANIASATTQALAAQAREKAQQSLQFD